MSTSVENSAAQSDATDLEALFDSIVASNHAVENPPSTEAVQPAVQANNVISQIGHLTRKLHDTLHELGYDGAIQHAAQAMPDARERLAYVSTMTEQAAVRTLNAVDAAKPLQEQIEFKANGLSQEWDRIFEHQPGVEDFKALVERTRKYLRDVPVQTKATNTHLTEIMMAQDFQDLTGQVIKRITEVAQDMEGQLIRMLIDNCPAEKREAVASTGLLNGPAMKGGADVVTNQNQVDDLLESLGF